jgi:hypothetical protein
MLSTIIAIALGLRFGDGKPAGTVTVTASLATYASLSFEGGQVIAEHQGERTAENPTGFTRDVWALSDVMLASGEGRLTVDESGLRVIPWPLPPLPPLPGTMLAVTEDWREPEPYNVPGVPEQNTLNEIAAR